MLLGKFAINGKGCSNIRDIVMNLMTLISQHHLAVLKPFVIIMVVKSCCCWSTATNRVIWLNSAQEIFLLAIINKEAFELAFPHSWLAVLHYIAVCFTSYLRGPSHDLYFFIIFNNSWFSKYVVHKWFMNFTAYTNLF